ncbi:hypothetical protein [Brevibacterium marinum]|uniref:DUF4333 domain-containing protein n=1 Tax=Brevibacterium marinum TaxID=418643 RepID=A0A846SB01_9MICO|nr:hypothetical protein [Brevibacterium marinum]NJC58462.1 hypothetical protein [Brevibacterium marinum]
MCILDILGEIFFDSSTDCLRWAFVTDLEHESPNANTSTPTSADSVDKVIMYTTSRHQESTMKTTKLIRSIAVAGTAAAALSLSACDMHVSFGDPAQDQTEAQERDGSDASSDEDRAGETRSDEVETNDAVTEDAPDTSSGQGTASNDGTSSGYGSSSSDSGTSTSDAASASSDATSASGTSTSAGEGSSSSSGEDAGSGDPGFEIDEHGNGEIPAAMLEDDIRDAYSKQGTTVEEVECLNDLMIISKQGSASCNVTAYGEKRYGTVKVTSVTGSNVHYKLDFPSFS